MNYESYDQSFSFTEEEFIDLRKRVWQLEVMRMHAENAAHATMEELEDSQKQIHGLTETIEILKQQIVAAKAETAKARQQAEEWRKAYDDLAKCL